MINILDNRISRYINPIEILWQRQSKKITNLENFESLKIL